MLLNGQVDRGPAGTRSRQDVDSTSVPVPGGHLDVTIWGSGEPIVFIQTALTADELLPLATDPALDGYRKILHHRRGYAASSALQGARSIAHDALDCAALLTELGIERAHVVGLSYAGAVALQLAADAPGRTHSLTLMEPPPLHTASAPEFRAANDRLVATRQQRGVAAALDEFCTMVIGPRWEQVAEERLPGSSTQMRRDARAFFDTDLPALLHWRFGSDDVSRIDCPVLYVGGADSGPWFAEVRELILSWFPDAEDVVINGADHSLAVTHAPLIARKIAEFLRRHPS